MSIPQASVLPKSISLTEIVTLSFVFKLLVIFVVVNIGFVLSTTLMSIEPERLFPLLSKISTAIVCVPTCEQLKMELLKVDDSIEQLSDELSSTSENESIPFPEAFNTNMYGCSPSIGLIVSKTLTAAVPDEILL